MKFTDTQGESQRARNRRLKEGFFDEFCVGRGLDIGAGRDPLFEDIETWDYDRGNGDATLMDGVENCSYDYVYCSHILEHLKNPWKGVANWFRILKDGGYLIVAVPHRDLYEKKLELPSNWNPDHKTYWLLERHTNPFTLGLIQTVQEALTGVDYAIIQARVMMRGLVHGNDPTKHSWGEYSCEIVVKKGKLI